MPKLLRATQERGIWEEIIRDSDAGNELLQIATTADLAFDAWILAWAWHVPFDGSEWNDTSDSEAFRGWVSKFLEQMEIHHWLSEAQLARFLRGQIENGAIEVPEEISLAGFVGLTPEQDLMFTTLQHYGCQG